MSRDDSKTAEKQISLWVSPEDQARFTTLLQSGIYLYTAQGTKISTLLTALPGFSREYMEQRLETVFLDGLPVDDLEQALFGAEAVLALSAVMPGLAGAIFRKGGIHAPLRTASAAVSSQRHTSKAPVTVRLKLFNTIAVERGIMILATGCQLRSSSLSNFLAPRPPLLATIQQMTVNGHTIAPQDLNRHLHSSPMITLSVRTAK